MEPIFRDVRLALRRLRLSPGFTIFAVVSLALGIGVSTAIYSAVRSFLWMPLGIADQNHLIELTSGRMSPTMSWPDFVDFRAAQSTFALLGASDSFRAALVAGETAEPVFGAGLSGDYFTTMGVAPRVGRLLQRGDESTAAPVAVLSERFWRTRLDADPGVVGRTIKLGGTAFEVIGVTAGSFHGLERIREESVWIPLTAIPATRTFGRAPEPSLRRAVSVRVWGRLCPRVSDARAASEASLIGQRLDAAFPRGDHWTRSWGVRSNATQTLDSETVDTIVGMILTAVLMVLLIACSNLANLALAKGTAREQETAVRSALGASRWRLVREQLIEGGIVTAAGAALGMLVLSTLTDYFTTNLPTGGDQTIPFRPVIDGTVLAACAGAATLSLLVFTLWPALQSTAGDLRKPLGSGASATPPRWRLHRNLVAWQVCGSVAMLLVAAMTAKVVAGIGHAPSGGSFRHLALAQIDFGLNGRDEAQARRVVEQMLAGVRAQPGIDSVSVSNGLPFGFSSRSMLAATTTEAPFDQTHDIGVMASAIAASPEIFRTFNLRLIRGRDFTERDDAAAPPVAIVSEHLARQLFRTADVVGRRLLVGRGQRLSPRWPAPVSLEIVGVSADTNAGDAGAGLATVFFRPFAQAYDPRVPVSLIARANDETGAVGALGSTIRRVDPAIAVNALGTGSALLDAPYFYLRVILAMSTSLGVLALILAMAGLFGVLSHVVARRTREIGIRIAIGAERAQIFRLILRDGLYPVAKGLALGLGIGVGARIAVRSWVATNASAFDPVVLAVVPVPFVIAALIACYVPAARASRVDPNVALRDL